MRAHIGWTLMVLLAAGDAAAQVTRTWVSGVGDDANPCSRTAPCLTFDGAFAKTAAGGEISVLDPGDFGSLTITHSVTISAEGGFAAIQAAATAITIQAGATDVVTLKNLRLGGTGAGYGVSFLSGGALHINDVAIAGFSGGGIHIANHSPAFVSLWNVRADRTSGSALELLPTARLDVVGGELVLAGDTAAVSVGDYTRLMLTDSVLEAPIGEAVAVSAASGRDSAVNLDRVWVGTTDTGFSATGPATIRLSNVTALASVTAVAAQSGNGRVFSFNNNRLIGTLGALCRTVSVSSSGAATAEVGTNYSATLTEVGAYGAATFTVITGSLPSGVLLAGATLSGTPSEAGDFSFTIRAVDGNGCAATQAFSLQVQAAPGPTGPTGPAEPSGPTAPGPSSPDPSGPQPDTVVAEIVSDQTELGVVGEGRREVFLTITGKQGYKGTATLGCAASGPIACGLDTRAINVNDEPQRVRGVITINRPVASRATPAWFAVAGLLAPFMLFGARGRRVSLLAFVVMASAQCSAKKSASTTKEAQVSFTVTANGATQETVVKMKLDPALSVPAK